jgi:hypothetical protein
MRLVSFRLTAVYQIPLAQRLRAGIDAGMCPKPGPRSAGPRHLAESTGARVIFAGTNGTNGPAFAASRPREASG